TELGPSFTSFPAEGHRYLQSDPSRSASPLRVLGTTALKFPNSTMNSSLVFPFQFGGLKSPAMPCMGGAVRYLINDRQSPASKISHAVIHFLEHDAETSQLMGFSACPLAGPTGAGFAIKVARVRNAAGR